ncbi:MAG: hypothetical protein ABIH72_04810, partial [archaeon]
LNATNFRASDNSSTVCTAGTGMISDTWANVPSIYLYKGNNSAGLGNVSSQYCLYNVPLGLTAGTYTASGTPPGAGTSWSIDQL